MALILSSFKLTHTCPEYFVLFNSGASANIPSTKQTNPLSTWGFATCLAPLYGLFQSHLLVLLWWEGVGSQQLPSPHLTLRGLHHHFAVGASNSRELTDRPQAVGQVPWSADATLHFVLPGLLMT